MLNNDNDLETPYSVGDYSDVSSDNTVRVAQVGMSEYMIHQFKDYVGTATSCTLLCNLQSTLAPSASIVKLQIYNRDDNQWDDVDEDNETVANLDFNLTGIVDISAHYKDASNVISCRVYQQAT